MKIGYLSFRISGTDGVSLEVHRWKQILNRSGHKVTLIAGELDNSGFLIPHLHFTYPEAYKIHELVIKNDVNYKVVEDRVFELAFEIEKELRETFTLLQLDALIVSNVFSLPIHFPLAVALDKVIKEFKLPTISRNHDFWWERQRYLKSHCFEFFEKYFPPKNEFIKHVTINSIACKEFKRRTGLDSVVIGDCFDFSEENLKSDDYTLGFREDFDVSKDDIVFLQATRIVPRKNIELAIELIARINNPRILFVLAGYSGDESGDYLQQLKDLIKKTGIRAKFIGDRIKGHREIRDGIKYYTLWDCFNNCDFVTYPSEFEGFGNQFIEAVAFKKPVFVNRYSVFKADIEPLGFETVAINGEVTQEAVEKVKTLLEAPFDIAKMTEKNFELGKQYFSYEATVLKMEKLGF